MNYSTADSLDNNSISIIIPAYNEEGNLQGSIDASVYAAEKNFKNYEIIIVDDGSMDRTLAIAEENSKRNLKIKVISHGHNQGFGASYNTGRKSTRMKYTVMVHGDDVFDKETLSSVFSQVGKADVVAGYIANPESRSKARQVISNIFTQLMNFLFHQRLKYYNGIQIHETIWLQKLKLSSTGFGFHSELLIKAIKDGKSYVEVPYVHTERPGGGATKIFKLKNVFSVIKTVFHLIFWKKNKMDQP